MFFELYHQLLQRDYRGKQKNKISPRMEDKTSEAEQRHFGTVAGTSVSVVKSKLVWIVLSPH